MQKYVCNRSMQDFSLAFGFKYFFILYEVVDIVYFPALLIEYSDLIQDDYLDLDYIRFFI